MKVVKKSEFHPPSVSFLGYTIAQGSVQMDLAKVPKCSVPNSCKQLHRYFLLWIYLELQLSGCATQQSHQREEAICLDLRCRCHLPVPKRAVHFRSHLPGSWPVSPVCSGVGRFRRWGGGCPVHESYLKPEASSLYLLLMLTYAGIKEIRHWDAPAAHSDKGSGAGINGLDWPYEPGIHLFSHTVEFRPEGHCFSPGIILPWLITPILETSSLMHFPSSL